MSYKNKTFNTAPVLAIILLSAVSFFAFGCNENGTSDNFFGKKTSDTQKTTVKSWKLVGDTDFLFKPAQSPILFFNYLIPYASFIDMKPGVDNKVSVIYFDGFIWKEVKTRGASFTPASLHSFNIYKNTLYIAYTESTEENKISVIGFIGNEWQYIGKQAFSHKKASGLDFEISNYSNDKFYVAYSNGDDFDRPYVWRRYGEDWKQLGAGAASSSSVKNIKLEIYNDTPYIAYIDINAAKRVSVLKYNGASDAFEALGSLTFTTPGADYLDFKFIDGTAYIAFSDAMNNSKARVMKYNGTSWESIDSAGVSGGPASCCALCDYNGTLYIAFRDFTKEGRATVMKYENKSWALVGLQAFTNSDIKDINLKICQDVPYIAFIDKSDSDKLVVMKYE